MEDLESSEDFERRKRELKKMMEKLLHFARKRGYKIDNIYRPSRWWRAELTHWSGCKRRAWFEAPNWRWE